ncbi:Ig-like domain-containing protein [bacterium]|nr:Ig-like domain-containing protein [bacterium]
MHSKRWIQVVLALVTITSLLAGCRFPWQAAEESESTETSKVTQVLDAAEPRNDLPPALVEVDPLPESVIGLTQPLMFTFNQAMDADSVESAIRFEPSTDGAFTWPDDRTLVFTPDQPLAAGSELLVRINTGAQAENGETLQESVEIVFQTTETLEVLQAAPADGSGDVDPEGAVFLAFNQPVVSLGGEAEADPAFTLSPEAEGRGTWLNTSTYIFYPEPSLDSGATYTLTVNPELESTSGAGLDDAQPESYSFTTTEPEVLTVLPLPDEPLSLDGPVTVRFNIRMDPETVEDQFNLLAPNGDAARGTFEWAEDLKSFEFIPDPVLQRQTTYTTQIGPGAQSYGGLTLGTAYEAERTTYPVFSTAPFTSPSLEIFYANYGQYRLYFTTPVDEDTYADQISITPEIGAMNMHLSDGGTTLTIYGYFEPEANYTLTLESGLQDRWGGSLGQPVTYAFTAPPAIASLSIISGETSHNLAFIPAEVSELSLRATNINTLTLEIAPLPIDELITLLHPENYNLRLSYAPAEVETSTRNLDLPRNESQIVSLPLSYQGESLQTGAYYLGISSPDITDATVNSSQNLILIVSENHLALKVSPDQAFVWATKLDGFGPLEGADVSVYTTDGDLLADGVTDADGLFMGETEGYDEAYSSFFAVLGEPGESDFAFSISTWGQGYSLYEQGISVDTMPALRDVYLYTDRPIYRPGDTVYFRAIVFNRENGLPVPPELDSIDVSVYGDPGMSGMPLTLFDETMTLDDYGAVSGEAEIPADASPGYYHIETAIDDKVLEALYFDVAEYRKPEIEVSVLFSQDEALAGETLTGSIQADYYFGVPAAEQDFSWVLFREDARFDLPGYQVGPLDDGWLVPHLWEYSPFGTEVARGSGQTDAQGGAALAFSSEDLALDEVADGQMLRYTLEVTVTDESGLPTSYRESVIVHPEEVYIGVQPEILFGAAEREFSFLLQTVDWVSEPVGDQSLEATFETIEWEAQESGNPEQPYEYVARTEFVTSASPVSGPDGQTRVSFTPEDPGTYRVTLKHGDAVTQVLVWVSGAQGAIWPRQIGNRITLETDAESYLPDETAEVFIPNSFTEGATALVTVERGRVMATQVLEISGSGAFVEIPLGEDAAPNVYVSVLLLGQSDDGAPDYRQGVVNLPVTPVEQTLNVALEIEPDLTEPGETVSATLTVTDAQGDPVQGEFSVAVVDKALLALMEPYSLPILEDLYGSRPLSVQTSYSLKTYATQLAQSALELGRGGGGADAAESTSVREDFPDTAFWRADVITGADGTALLEIPLPDSLTTWVVDVRGLTEDYKVGQVEAEVVTQKQLMVRPVTPRFLVEGDQVELAAVVHNNTNESQTVDVALQSSGFTLADEAIQTQQVTIAAGDSVRVAWWGTVDGVDTVELTFSANAGALSDASAPTWGDLSVLRYTMPNTFSTSGQLEDAEERLELVSLPAAADPSTGSFSLELMPSLTAALVEGLDVIAVETYNDTLSILSRLMANLTAYEALNDLGVDSPQLVTDLGDAIRLDVRQLAEAQLPDGGWSWWAGERGTEQQADPFISAYVIMGLTQASEAGFEVGEYILMRAKESLTASLVQPGEIDVAWRLDRLAFQAYALRGGDVDLTSIVEGLYARRSELSPWASALLALTLQDEAGAGNRVNTLLSDLETLALRSATGVHWESERSAWMLPGTPTFNTAVGIIALAKLDPASTSLPMALRYLLAHRQASGAWGSTFESAWSLMAITAALQGTGDYQADFDFQAALNGTVIAEGSAAGADSTTSITATVPVGELFPQSPNALQIQRGEGSGTLYYRADLRTFQQAETAEAINKGISLSRAYYPAGEGCPGDEDCTPMDGFILSADGTDQLVTVALTVVIPYDMYNLTVEDYIPSGSEVLNRDLLTSQTVSDPDQPVYDPRRPFASGWGWWYFNAPQIYDDHLFWTGDYVPAGTYTLTYEILPYQRGIYQVLPARAWQYFFPEVQGTSAGALFTIE